VSRPDPAEFGGLASLRAGPPGRGPSTKSMNREISINNAHPRLRVDRRALAAAIGLLDAHAAKFQGGCPAGELSLVFLTDAALAKIHGEFMADPTATDVITFEGDISAGLAGEICVSAVTAWRYVEGPAPAGPRASRGAALQIKFSAELMLYVVHGWLHLAGYDDLQPAKKRRMRAAEARAMKLLRKERAVPEFRLA
jgi:probable rRNA maturation factor